MEENNINKDSLENSSVGQNINYVPVEPVFEDVSSHMGENNETTSLETSIPTIQPAEQVIVEESNQSIEAQDKNEQVQVVEEENEIKTSGTADESELFIDAVKPEAEIIDEYVIKRSITSEEKRYKKNTIFILIVVFLIIIFIVALPFITKWIGF